MSPSQQVLVDCGKAACCNTGFSVRAGVPKRFSAPQVGWCVDMCDTPELTLLNGGRVQ